ncbi:hypothetical protein C900_00418 [Fulvivirga imtechensis AK7]|uniref:histidine kinase n=1 Tax=Fulvivirga imtechensis AK7 TaxID=1237149 RepID=L8JHP9_9BACT|nr:tetratricopeptide repeat protein [Fulvivirga imtechensis]ELR68386.1 hypothetical protein C900_00418 [Fulvivirga imtechensis AK7]
MSIRATFILLLLVALASAQNNQELEKSTAQKYNDMAMHFHHSGEYDSSIIYYEKSAALFATENDTVRVLTNEINIGKAYRDMSQYDRALDRLYKAAHQLESCCEDHSLWLDNYFSCYTTIASVYRSTNDHLKAEEYYFKLDDRLKDMDAKNAKILEARNLNNLGNLYLTTGNHKSAKTYFTRSLELNRALQNRGSMGLTLSNLGIIEIDLYNYKEAENNLLEALAIKEEAGSKKSMVYTLNQLGRLYVALDQPQKATGYLQRAEIITREIGTLDLMVENLEFRIALLKLSGPDSKLSALYDEYISLKDSLMNKEKVEKLAEMQVRYETEKKQQEISILEQDKELQQAAIELRQAWIVVLLIGLLFIAATVILVYQRLKRENRNKRKIETLMKEVQHRIKNNLQILSSLLSLQTRTLEDAKAIAAIKSGESRINAMALIHQKINSSQQYTQLNIRDYINDIIEYLRQAYGLEAYKQQVQADVVDAELDVDLVIPLGLITNELVSNAFKYTFPRQKAPQLLIHISFIEYKKLQLVVKDNGPGFSENGTSLRTGSLGLQIVDTLVKQLKATISRDAGDGFATIIEVPIKNNPLWKK